MMIHAFEIWFETGCKGFLIGFFSSFSNVSNMEDLYLMDLWKINEFRDDTRCLKTALNVFPYRWLALMVS